MVSLLTTEVQNKALGAYLSEQGTSSGSLGLTPAALEVLACIAFSSRSIKRKSTSFSIPTSAGSSSKCAISSFCPVYKGHSPAVITPPITIIETVDGGTALVVTADGHHPILPGLETIGFDFMRGDLRLARLVWEFSAMADRVWQMKAALANPRVEIFEKRESHGQSNRGSWHS